MLNLYDFQGTEWTR